MTSLWSQHPTWLAQRTILAGAALLALLSLWLLPPLFVLVGIVCILGGLGILRFPLLGFCLIAFAVPWGSTLTLSAGSFPITPTEPIVAILTFALVVRSVAYRENPLASQWTPWILLFLAAIALSTTQALDTRVSEREIVKWLEMAVIYVSGCAFIRTRRHVHTVVAALVAAGVSQAALGFYQSALSAGPAAFATQHIFLRAYGSFDQPNPYAGYLNLVLPLGVAVALTGGLSAPLRRVYWAAAIVIAGALLASESRAGLLAGLGGVGLVLAFTYRHVLSAFLLGVLAALGAALTASFGVLSLGPLQRVLTSLGLGDISFNDVNDANFSAVERAAHWLAGVRMFAAHPLLGVGIGNYGAAYPAYHPRGWYASLDHAHNYYINIAAEAGIVGLTAYALLVGSALWYGYSAVRARREPLIRAAGLGVTGALVATSLHNIFDMLYVHGIAALLGLLMAVTAAGGTTAPAAEVLPSSSSPDDARLSYPARWGAEESNT